MYCDNKNEVTIPYSMDQCKTPPNEPSDNYYMSNSPDSIVGFNTCKVTSNVVTPERKKTPSSPPGLKKRERGEYNRNDIYSIPSFPSLNGCGESVFSNLIPNESGSVSGNGNYFQDTYSNFTKNTPSGNWRNTNNSFVSSSLYPKNPEKEERNKEVLKKVKILLSKNNGLFPYEALKELQATYEKNQEERDSGIKEHKKPLGMLKSIKLGGEKSDL